jgi:hypothetical protein
VGFEPTISGSRSRRSAKLSHALIAPVGLDRQSTQRESNPHVRHGEAVGYRLHHGCCVSDRIVKEESTGWDSNPRFRDTGAESSPLDHQCHQAKGPVGLEPTPTG